MQHGHITGSVKKGAKCTSHRHVMRQSRQIETQLCVRCRRWALTQHRSGTHTNGCGCCKITADVPVAIEPRRTGFVIYDESLPKWTDQRVVDDLFRLEHTTAATAIHPEKHCTAGASPLSNACYTLQQHPAAQSRMVTNMSSQGLWALNSPQHPRPLAA